MTERKLPNPSEYKDEKMTEKDWDFYFECRSKYDIYKTDEEVGGNGDLCKLRSLIL